MRERAPVFVVGSARSGNTLLYHCLLGSGFFPQYRTEPVVFDVLAPRFGDFRRRHNRERLMKCWLRSRQYRLAGLDAEPVLERVLNHTFSAGTFLSYVMDEIARAQGCQRWAVWGPDNLLHMRTIKQQIPAALFVHVVRDGRDVAYALYQRGFIRPFPWDRRFRLLVSALHWKWKIEQGRRMSHKLGDDYLEVRFEDLVLNPRATLECVGNFIGLPLDYDLIQKSRIGAIAAPNTSFPGELEQGCFAPVERWKRQLTSEEVKQIESLIGDQLRELGYPLSVPGPVEPGSRLCVLQSTYPRFYSLKEWLRVNTLLGRWVSLSRLHLQR